MPDPTPYLGEIRMFGGNFAPQGWAFCDGSLLSISQNETLFYLIGTTYGGDGQDTFALPDLRGRIPVHQGNGLFLGEAPGSETVTLNTPQLPQHTHPYGVVGDLANSRNPQDATFATTDTTRTPYTQLENSVQLGPPSTVTGGTQPHENRMPYLCISFIIALNGIFPSQG